MKKVLRLLLLVCCLALLLTSCSSPLVGSWTTTIDGEEGQMTLKRNGTGEIVSNGISRPCTWYVKDNTLSVVQDIEGSTFVFLDCVSYEINDNTLTIVSYDGSKTLVFEKN